MTRTWIALAALIVVSGVLGGCATSRSEIALSAPLGMEAPPATGKPVVIRLITDERVFEQAPRDPGTPSLGFEGSAQATAETKARAVGRKRNGYGMAMGDVLLQPGQSVDKVIRENLTAALQQSGYRVVSASEATPPALAMDVRIRRFWSWIQPGFWAITLHTAITTDLQFPGNATPTVVDVTSTESLQLGTDSNWIEAIGKALAVYRTEATKALRGR